MEGAQTVNRRWKGRAYGRIAYNDGNCFSHKRETAVTQCRSDKHIVAVS